MCVHLYDSSNNLLYSRVIDLILNILIFILNGKTNVTELFHILWLGAPVAFMFFKASFCMKCKKVKASSLLCFVNVVSSFMFSVKVFAPATPLFCGIHDL